MHSIIARGAHTAYIDTHPNAPEKAPVVLCLHGIATSSYMYRNVTKDLSFRARVIAPDLPGFGQSQKKCPWQLSIPNFTQWLDNFIEQVIGDDQRIYLVLHDLSGPIGLNWAIKNQNRIKSVLLLNTSIFVEHFRPPLIALASAIPKFGNKLLHRMIQPNHLSSFWKGEFSSPVSNECIEHYCAPYTDIQTRDALSEVFNQFPSSVVLIHQLREQIKELKTPCSILFGAADQYCKPANATSLARAIDGSTLRFIQDIGHFIAEDAPYAIAEEMRELMNKAGDTALVDLGITTCNEQLKQPVS